MKLIRAIVRPEKVDEIVDELKQAGYPALTRMDVVGRGKQMGIRVGSVHYDEIPKVMLMIVADDGKVEEIMGIIARAGYTGNFGDGKIFVSPVEDAYTIRTGSREL
ncbi:P-II family nitrogen regulator [Desulforudis sp. 1088]|jgi:nitrogen regulatory protein PII 1|uniref:P-II family nitrogen regulator n=1 Tax=unclassified Candidatus Desulforudis TaxID=2635950 RepID=UPI003474D5D7